MTSVDVDRLERRVLVLAPMGKDAVLTCDVLKAAGIECVTCPDVESLAREMKMGAGALIVAEEAVARHNQHTLTAVITEQPPWSDLPVLFMTRRGADSPVAAQAMQTLGNIALLERPIRVTALVSAVRTALRARQRQYQIRAHLLEREHTALALQEADRRKDEFLATLAHELRNPLAPICNSIQILRLTGGRGPEAGLVYEMMERQIQHMVRLVDDLLDVSRITRGKFELRKEPVELSAVIRGGVETSRPIIEAAHHELSIVLPPEPLVLNADAVRLAQVFANLLNNAAKYMTEGGQIWVTAVREGDEVAVSVRDCGLGIPTAMLSQVFDLFTQVDREIDRAQGGLGIGLTLVRQLVHMHDGSVEARSEGPNRGSEFIVRLPLAQPSHATRGEPRERQRAQLSPRRLLVVDDNQDAARSLGMLLELLGAEVRVVHNGSAALESLATYRPNLVLLDIGMPGMDGYEVARRIRQRPDSQDITLVALTGWGQEQDRNRTRTVGFDHHLIKPPDVDALQELLAALERTTKPRQPNG